MFLEIYALIGLTTLAVMCFHREVADMWEGLNGLGMLLVGASIALVWPLWWILFVAAWLYNRVD